MRQGSTLRFIAGMTYEALVAGERTLDAVIWKIEVIGVAAVRKVRG